MHVSKFFRGIACWWSPMSIGDGQLTRQAHSYLGTKSSPSSSVAMKHGVAAHRAFIQWLSICVAFAPTPVKMPLGRGEVFSLVHSMPKFIRETRLCAFTGKERQCSFRGSKLSVSFPELP